MKVLGFSLWGVVSSAEALTKIKGENGPMGHIQPSVLENIL